MIQLCFAAKWDPSESDNTPIPINQIGGVPQWLSNPSINSIKICQSCNVQMPLLLQIYAPEDYPPCAFHRVLFVFCCKNGSCHQLKKNYGLAVLRSQLELDNQYFTKDCIRKVGWLVSCKVCGCYGGLRFGDDHYCSKEHQVLDTQKEKLKDYSALQFPLMATEEDEEPEKSTFGELLETLKKQLDTIEDGDDVLADENETEMDQAFLKFQKRIGRDSEQVLRYGRTAPEGNEEPLWVSDEGVPKNIPPCPHCNAPRTFEFQIMPQLLSYLDIDSRDPKSLDWGTIVVYSCSKHCDAANDDLVEEYWIRQNFSRQGLTDEIVKELAAKEN